MLASTVFDTRLAVGRFGWIRANGRVRPTARARAFSTRALIDNARRHSLVTATGMMMNRSMYRNCAPSVASQRQPEPSRSAKTHLEIPERRRERVQQRDRRELYERVQRPARPHAQPHRNKMK